MPELPEVEITARKLTPLVGKSVLRFFSHWPKSLHAAYSPVEVDWDIRGRAIETITRHGKVVFLNLGLGPHPKQNTERVLAFHQRMSGRLFIKLEKWHGAKEMLSPYVRTQLIFERGVELHFLDPRKFGVVWYGSPQELGNDPYIKSLGPDALGIAPEVFKQRFAKRSGAIKPLLLRQDIVAGIGNIIADETLWKAKIHPLTLLPTLGTKDHKRLHESLQETLKRAIKANGSTLKDWKHPDGESGGFAKYMKVYSRKGQPCETCTTPIIRMVVGGRGTWICTSCQHKI